MDEKLTQKFIEDQCTIADLETIKAFLEEGTLSEIETFLEQVWAHTPGLVAAGSLNTEALYQHILNKLEDKPTAHIIISSRREFPFNKERKGIVIRYAIAASVTIITIVGLFLYLQNPKTSTPQHLDSYRGNTITKANPRGQKSTFILPDGTKVFLNAESQIKYPEGYANFRRQVTLTGEAFFDVAQNPNDLFIIHTDQLTTTVLGTTFNVKAFQNENTQITVATGKVKVEASNTSRPHSDGYRDKTALTLTSNQQIQYDLSTKKLIKKTVDASQTLAWTTNTLIFKDTPFAEIKGTLARWYDVEFIIKGYPQGKTLKGTGSFENNPSLARVLQVLGDYMTFDYEIDEKTVKIEFK